MSNLSIKINLTKLPGAALVNIKGKTATKQCVIIPVEDASLFIGEKGAYLDLTGIENREQTFGQSHFVKQNLPEEKYKALSDEERKAQPIVGSIKPFVAPTMQAAADLPDSGEIEADDLPF